jgi:uncharacterized membrane protein YphA (DoxX/SURF4 family)
MEANRHPSATLPKSLALILWGLRLAVGWHFLYEGLAKLLTPSWTAAPYLILARGPFAHFFQWLGSSPGLLRTIDLLNIWGLVLIGLALMLGCFSRIASASGIVMLALYYLAQPALIQTDYRIPLEGHYLLVNKNVVELLALVVFLVLPSGTLGGIDRLVRRWRARKKAGEVGDVTLAASVPSGGALSRRETLENLVGVPLLGILGYAARKKYGWEKVHAITGATIKLSDLSLKDLKGRLPQGTLGKLKISRVILGGNLIGGGAHSRDLIYVPSLFRAYNTDRKIFETLELAERAGVDTCLLSSGQIPLLNKYREVNSSKMQTVCQVFPRTLLEFLTHPVCTPATVQDFMADIDRAIDYGANTVYVNGAFAERLMTSGRMDLLAKALDRIKSQGYPGGIGGHSIEVPIRCEQAGLQPDYYVKSFHHDKYWSAHPRENRVEFSVDGRRSLDHNQFHDNMFDLFPEKTIAFMQGLKKPWIAFKVLAGGAIHPKDGFKFAFENGADFICVGMLDYQIVEDVNIAVDVLANLKSRPRPWCA